MIKLDSVTFSYSSSDSAILKRVHLEIGKGELVLIAGPTGSGKSTLLKVINRLAPQFTGAISADQFQSMVETLPTFSQMKLPRWWGTLVRIQ